MSERLRSRRRVLGHYAIARARLAIPAVLIGLLPATSAAADAFFFSIGNPDGKIATLSRTASSGKLETETADDFSNDTCVTLRRRRSSATCDNPRSRGWRTQAPS